LLRIFKCSLFISILFSDISPAWEKFSVGPANGSTERGTGKPGTIKNAGVENVGLENAGSTILQGRKTRDQ